MRTMRPLSDEERYERETERIREAEEQMDLQDKVLSRLERMEHRIRRIELFNKRRMNEVHRYTKSTLEVILVVLVAVIVWAISRKLGR
jgi:hypothetical protein